MYSQLEKKIATASSVSECETIQRNLKTLLKRAEARERLLQEREEKSGLNFKGRGAVSCDCGNRVDPRNTEFSGTCKGCRHIFCKECCSDCKTCGKVLCLDNCGITLCEDCDEQFCSDCAVECMKCGEETCKECVSIVTPAEWKCCSECRDDWVSNAWRKY